MSAGLHLSMTLYHTILYLQRLPKTSQLTRGTPSLTITTDWRYLNYSITVRDRTLVLFANRKSHTWYALSIGTNIIDLEWFNNIVTADARYLCGSWTSCYRTRHMTLCINRITAIRCFWNPGRLRYNVTHLPCRKYASHLLPPHHETHSLTAFHLYVYQNSI